MIPNDPSLLREFARDRSEEAFRALVRRHSPVVYGAALRKLNGDRAAAQDVTQEVFTLLVIKASRLENVTLSGWLYRQACRRASNHVRSETRRKRREQAAMETMETTDFPDTRFLVRELDNAMLHLPEADRDALVLRYFEGQEYRAVGKSLGLSEEAARKRIRRALDRLGVIFKRQGLAVTGVSLGTAMEGFGATPMSAAFVSQISMTAAAPAAPGLFPLLKAVAAGVVATSLAAGSALALRATPTEKAPARNVRLPIPTKESRIARVADKLRENPSLEQIIAEIRRIRSGPGNTLTTMRMQVALGKIGFGRIPEFISRANGSLNKAERETVYLPLLGSWWDKEPEAAINFILNEKVDAQVNEAGSTNLLGNCFRIWAWRDTSASEAWLLRNWKHESLGKDQSGGSLRNTFSMQVAGELFSNNGATAALDFAARLPTPEDRGRSLRGFVGLNNSDGIYSYSDEQKDPWRDFYRGLEKIPDDHWRRELTRGFWKNIGENQSAKFEEIKDFIHPSDPFTAALGLMSVRQTYGEPVNNLDGSFSNPSKPVSDRESREAAALEAGLAAGLSRQETLAGIGETLEKTIPVQDFFAWLDSHHDEVDLDDLLIAKARGMANSTRSDYGQEMEAIEWASRISDPDLRRSVCRGAFRRLLAARPEVAASYLKGSGIPEDLAAEFHEIQNQTP